VTILVVIAHLPNALVGYENQLVRHARVREELEVELSWLASDDARVTASKMGMGEEEGKDGLVFSLYKRILAQ